MWWRSWELTVVGLVVVAVDDVLVVVDGSALPFEFAAVVRVLEVADVEDVRGGEPLGHWADLCVALVELVVDEEVLLVHFVVDNAERVLALGMVRLAAICRNAYP